MEFEDVCVRKHTCVSSTFSELRACGNYPLTGWLYPLYTTHLLLNRADGVELYAFPCQVRQGEASVDVLICGSGGTSVTTYLLRDFLLQ